MRRTRRMQAILVRERGIPLDYHQPEHGWRYCSDLAAARAVVISAKGEYFYGRGKSLWRGRRDAA